MVIGATSDGEACDGALLESLQAHERVLREERIILYAGASLLSRAQRDFPVSDLSAMPAMGPVDDKEQPGSGMVASLERDAAELVCRSFGVAWADARLPSCTMANLATFSFLAKAGDLMLAPAATDGGHLSQRRGGTPSLLGLEVEDLPFDATNQCLDPEWAAALIKERKPRLVMLGRSVVLGPDRIEAVTSAARSVGATTIYDASHVAGLIAAKAFDNPLAAGADVVTSSTYKTLRGPPGSLVLFKDGALGAAFSRHLDATFLANQDASRFPSIISAIASCRPATGYGALVLRLADAFKRRLTERGLVPLLPERSAASHQVVLPIGPFATARAAMRGLEAGGILVGTCVVPGRPGEYGLRFGSQVAASLGFSEATTTMIADLTADIFEAAAHASGPLEASHPAIRRSLGVIKEIHRNATPD